MFNIIDSATLALIKVYQKPIVIENEEVIIHQGHIPRLAFILLNGSAEIILSKTKKSVLQNMAIAMSEAHNKVQFKNNVKVYPGAKIIVLEHSLLTRLNQLNNKNICEIINQKLMTKRS